MNIRGIYKTSLIDYPGRISTVLFSGGCNLRCRYCHNPDLACDRGELELSSNDDAIRMLTGRRRVIDGVTISGGEPTLSGNIDDFIEKIKGLALAVKLDSNGLQPGVLKRLIGRKLLDYVAVDIKTSPDKYHELAGAEVDFGKIAESVAVIRESGIDYEIRTTCIPGYAALEDMAAIRDAIGRVKRYYLQQFNSSVTLMDRAWEGIAPYPAGTLERLRTFVLTFADACEIRGI